jgi:hypothetical protein
VFPGYLPWNGGTKAKVSKLFIDHRARALLALRAELDSARGEQKPNHVVHFDGHSANDCTVGLSGLCFERHWDFSRLEQCRHVAICTSELDPLPRIIAYRSSLSEPGSPAEHLYVALGGRDLFPIGINTKLV